MLVADRALEASRLKREVKELKTQSVQASRIIGRSSAIVQLRGAIERIARDNARVMITGAPGSGKELAARTIHQLSSRSGGAFVAINAATITPENMEIALFGIEQGPNGAARDRRARGGAWRHDLSRRSGGHAERDAEQDPARARRSEFPARRRLDARACRCPRDLVLGA